MPLYVYRCSGCGTQLEKRQSFSDAPLTECESCGGRLHKVLQPSMVIYKGSGFYSTDYSSKSGSNGRNGGADKEKSEESFKAGLDAAKESVKNEPAKASVGSDKSRGPSAED